MNFSAIVKLLDKPLNLGSNQAARVKRLADIVTEGVDHAAEFHAALGGDAVLAKYAATNGRPIGPAFASAIVSEEYGTYSPDALVDRIDRLPSKVRDSLATQVKANIPHASSDNVGVLIAEALTDALADAVGDPVLRDAAVAAQTKAARSAATKRAVPLLLQQAGDLCMMPGCAQTLFTVDDTGKRNVTGLVRLINPDGEAADFENLAILCPTCSSRYTGDNPQARSALSEAKRLLGERQDANLRIIPTGIESQIGDVVESVAKADSSQIIPTQDWNAYEVQQKITTARMLATKVEGYMAVYFDYIEAAIQDLSQEGKLNFERVRSAFRLQYQLLSDTGSTQEQLFDSMTGWLIALTIGERSACEAVVSYFVQICEVFRADT